MHNPIQELYSVHDSGDVLNPSGKNFLSIELSPGGFSYCVLDTEKFRYTLLESFSLHNVTDFDQQAQILNDFSKNRKFLSSFYQRISFSYVSSKVTLVPTELFTFTGKKHFVDFNTYPDNDFEIKVDKLNNLNAYAVYPFPIGLLRKVNFLFPGCRIRHLASCLIENVLYMVRYGGQTAELVLHIQRDHFEILYIKDQNLSFFNSFNYQTWDDLFYFLFFVLEQLGLDAEQLNVLILGEVSIESELYRKMRLYVRSVSFGPRSELYKFADKFDDLPHHYFFNLLNLNSCG